MAFDYKKSEFRYIARYKDGKWQEGELSTDNMLPVSEASTAINYGQQCFEGLKAYRSEEGKINLFRPELNAKRLKESCERLLMPAIPEEMFINAVKSVVKANQNEVPEYGTGSTYYLRPLVIGIGDKLGVGPAPEFLFVVFGSPVGNYFANGLKPLNFCTTDYDRAAYNGTGGVKVGGNYAASMYAKKLAAEAGFDDCIYLDPVTHTKIEEVGAANFFGITSNNEFVTPKSNSILNSITKRSLMEIAEKSFDLKVIERDCYVANVEEFIEAGACGTAAVISAIKSIKHEDKTVYFTKGDEVGPIVKSLYDKLIDIQFAKASEYSNWLVEVELD